VIDLLGRLNDIINDSSSYIPVSSINKTDHHDIAEILLKVALNTINLTYTIEIPFK
jgi:hypothetical protein